MVLGGPMKLPEDIHFTNIKCKTQWNWLEVNRQIENQAFMSSGHEVTEFLLSSLDPMCDWPVGLQACP